MSFLVITRTADLPALIEPLARASFVALDTEFLRERTYFAKLCLVQLAFDDRAAAVDPLNVDLDPLLDCLYAPRLLKVLHAARQDLELFYDVRGAVPGPVFDTQIAAAYLGLDEQIGYGALVQQELGVTLSKAHTRTDWSARPLSAEQLQYAHDDVQHLHTLYPRLRERLEKLKRLAWVEEDCAALSNATLYANAMERIHLRIKQGQQLSLAAQKALRALAIWREEKARSRNLPRGWVARDADLMTLAELPSAEAIAACEALPPSLRQRAATLGDIVQQARHSADTTPLWPARPNFTGAQQTLLDRMLAHVRARAQQLGISPSLLATRRDLERFVLGETPAFLRGWRAEIIADDLRAVLHGRRAAV